MNIVPYPGNGSTLCISEIAGWVGRGPVLVDKGRRDKRTGISSGKVFFGVVSLCNREQTEVLKSRNSLTVCNFRKLE